MKTQSILLDSKVILKPFSTEHISDEYISWLNDKELMQYSRQRYISHDYHSCLDFAKSFDKSANLFWAVFSNDISNNHVGNITANIDENNLTSDLTLMIGNKKAQGRGFGMASWNLAMNFLLNELNLRKVTAGTMSINYPMINIMKNSGMENEACLKKHFLYNGIEVDSLIFSKYKT